MGPGGEAGERRAYNRLLGVVLATTGASLAFLVHEKGDLLAVEPGREAANDIAHQAAGTMEMATKIATILGVKPVNMVVLDGQGGRILLIAAEELILGCLVPREADIDAAVGALRRAFELL